MEKVKFDKIGFNLHQDVCSTNGLKIIVAPVFDAKEVHAGLYIDRGGLARDFFVGNTRIFPGTANLLVKSLFDKHPERCAPLFKEGVELKGYVEESFTTISYRAKMEDAKELLEPLLSIVDELKITNDEVEHLKVSYRKEILSTDAQPDNIIRKNLYVNSPMGKNPDGDLETLKKVHFVALKRYFESFYKVENMTLIVTGNISPDDVYEIANAHRFKRTKNDREIRIHQYVEPEGALKSDLTYTAPKNTLIAGIKFPERKVLFNMFGDHLFSYYALLQPALFSNLNSRTKEILKDVVDIKKGGIKQGGEDAFLYQTFEVGDMSKGISQVKELLSTSKPITRSDFKNLKKKYVTQQIQKYSTDVSEYFNSLCEDYANRFASQAITTAVSKMKYSKFVNFLDYLLKSPVSFAVEKD